MEDQKKDMTPRANKYKRVKKKSSRTSDLTVMIVANLGKVRSFKISPRFLAWSFLFFVFYIVVSIFIINDYFEKRWTNDFLTEQLENLQFAIEDTKNQLYKSKKHLVLLESHLYSKKTEIEEEEVKTPAGSEIQEKNTTLQAEDNPSKKVMEDSQRTPSDIVDIEDLEIKKGKNTFTVFFNLVNVNEKNKSVKGYVHIIAVNKKSDPPQLWTYPKVALQNGIPIDYKRGQLFLIKHFKTIRGEYFLDSGADIPSSIRILVYDQSGKMILEKEFEVENVS